MNKLLFDGSDDAPRFDIPLENELLKLKLKAEFGAECSTGSEKIPDIVVHEFLKSVYEFEQKFRAPRTHIRLFEKIGQPFFRRAEELTDDQLTLELKRMLSLLNKHHLQLDIMGEYPDRIIYSFIIEELFFVEMENIEMPGFLHHFCYEDFHPNHELDIKYRVVDFLSQWFGKQLNEYSWGLADRFFHPDSRDFSKEQVLKKIYNIFNAYVSFENCEYLIRHLKYEWNEKSAAGRAYVEGKVRYDALLENGDLVHVEEVYEFYLSNENNWWSIFYFVFPGFKW